MDFCCAICLESFGISCEIATIPCGHVFHEACIKKWHSAHKQCSQCRKMCESEEILRIFISETENGLKDNNLRIKYEERILNLKKEICNLKADKLGEESEINLKTANLELKAKNLKLEEETLTLKAKNLKLEEENLKFEKKNVELQSSQVRNCEEHEELHEENIKLSRKLQNLKFHERNTQQMLRDKIIEISSKRNDIKYDLDMQIAETKKAKREIMALEAKYASWVPSYQIPRRNYKRKPETTRQLESKPPTNQSPPQKKKKQTVQKQPAVESNTEVTELSEDVQTPTSPVNTSTTLLTSICNSLPSSSITREILEKRSRWYRFQSQRSSHIPPHSNSRSRSRSHSSASSHSNSHSRSRSHSSASSRSGSESSASRLGSPSHSRSRSRSGSSASSQSGSESSASRSSSPLRSRSRPRLLSSASSRSSSRSSTHSNRSRSRSRSRSHVRSRSRSSSPIYTVYQNIRHTNSFAVNQDNH